MAEASKYQYLWSLISPAPPTTFTVMVLMNVASKPPINPFPKILSSAKNLKKPFTLTKPRSASIRMDFKSTPVGTNDGKSKVSGCGSASPGALLISPKSNLPRIAKSVLPPNVLLSPVKFTLTLKFKAILSPSVSSQLNIP